MKNITELRKQYRQYNDMSDQQFADAFHSKYYSDIPKDDFYNRLGLNQSSASQDNVTPVPQEKPYERTPMDALRDVAGGIAGGSQNLASGLLEGGEYITRKGAEMLGKSLGHPVNVPRWNARQFMGLEGNNPIDLQKMIQSKHPDWLSGALGKYVLPSLAGGSNLARQALMQGAYGASQASPDQPNAMGFLPKGPLGAGIQDAGSVLAGGKLLPLMARGLGNTFSTIRNAFRPINPRDVSTSIQATHDNLLKSAEDIFSDVEKTVSKRGMLASVIPVKPDLIDNITPYLANTRATKKLIDNARSGDYSALRKLQTELFHKGTAAEKSLLPSEKLKGEEIFDLRDRVNESITKHFRKTGNDDLADKLEQAKRMYRNLKQTYYNKKLPVAARDLVHPDVRKMPRNALNTFSEESKPMQRLLSQNPLAAQKIEQYIARNNALEKLKHIGVGSVYTAGIGAPLYGAKKGYDYLTRK